VVTTDSDARLPSDGVARAVARLADPAVGLVTLPYRGGRVLGLAAALESLGITTAFLPSWCSIAISGAGRAVDALALDVVHVQDHFPLGRAAPRARATRGVPLVATNQKAGALARLSRAQRRQPGDLHGFGPPPQLPALLACADYFAMAGDVELQSTATLEAMAAGLPVLAAAAGALPELVADGVNDALFRANDPADTAARMAALLAAGDH
jgi:hypothetical protein